MPGRALANYVVGAREGKLASARPGAVRAPPGGLGQFLAIVMSTRAKLHAHIAAYGRRWPSCTRRNLGAISILTRVEIAPRSCRCQEAT